MEEVEAVSNLLAARQPFFSTRTGVWNTQGRAAVQSQSGRSGFNTIKPTNLELVTPTEAAARSGSH